MKPEKFIKSYKCDCFQPQNYCNCTYKIYSSDALIENVKDIAESLVEAMNLYGIFTVKRKPITDVIIYYFLHFEEIIHRIDTIPRKRLNKEDLMHDLNRKCNMSRIESQMAYSIIKRVFKAFYHGTGPGGVPDNILMKKLTHSSECLWVHAAKRTAQIYASYEGVFYPFKKDLECKIKLVYKQLYDRILSRNEPNDDHECICKKCMLRITKETLRVVTVTTGMHVVHDKHENDYLKEQEKYFENANTKTQVPDIETGNKDTTSCSCPSLSMTKQDYIYRKNAESTQTGSSQGPFNCRWFLISKEEYEADDADIDIKLPCEFPCTPCHSEEECDSECECTCVDCTCVDCTCKSESQKEYEDQGEIEQELGNEEISGLTDFTTSERDVCIDI